MTKNHLVDDVIEKINNLNFGEENTIYSYILLDLAKIIGHKFGGPKFGGYDYEKDKSGGKRILSAIANKLSVSQLQYLVEQVTNKKDWKTEPIKEALKKKLKQVKEKRQLIINREPEEEEGEYSESDRLLSFYYF